MGNASDSGSGPLETVSEVVDQISQSRWAFLLNSDWLGYIIATPSTQNENMPGIANIETAKTGRLMMTLSILSRKTTDEELEASLTSSAWYQGVMPTRRGWPTSDPEGS